MRACNWLGLWVAVFSGSSALAQEVGDVAAGQEFARSVCAGCHAIDVGDYRSPNSAAPAFETIANVPGMTATALLVVLSNPHREMPDLILERDDLNDVVAYLLTLKHAN